MVVYRGLIVTVAFLMASCADPINAENDRYFSAVQSNDELLLQAFLEDFPNSNKFITVKERLKNLEKKNKEIQEVRDKIMEDERKVTEAQYEYETAKKMGANEEVLAYYGVLLSLSKDVVEARKDELAHHLRPQALSSVKEAPVEPLSSKAGTEMIAVKPNNNSNDVSPGDTIMINMEEFLDKNGRYKYTLKHGAFIVGIVDQVLGDKVKYYDQYFICGLYQSTAEAGPTFYKGSIMTPDHGYTQMKIDNTPQFIEISKVHPLHSKFKDLKKVMYCNKGR